MFHVKHLCVPFAVKCLHPCAYGGTCRGEMLRPAQRNISPLRAHPGTCVQVFASRVQVVEERKTFDSFRRLKPHHQASLRAELTSPRGALRSKFQTSHW
jgi:hypothetical protein